MNEWVNRWVSDWNLTCLKRKINIVISDCNPMTFASPLCYIQLERGGLFTIGIVIQLPGVAKFSLPVSATKINNEIFWSSNWRSRPCLATEPTSDDVVWGTRYSSTMGPRPLRAVGPPRGVTPAARGRRRDCSVCLTVVMGTGTDS